MHESIYEPFITKFADLVTVTPYYILLRFITLWLTDSRQKYRLGDPTKPDTNLGPVVSLASAERIRNQVTDAGIFVHFIAKRIVDT